MVGATVDQIYESLRTLSSAEQDQVLKDVADKIKRESVKQPTYAEVVAGVKVPRASTPEPKEVAHMKRELNSPESPYKGGSRKVRAHLKQ
jgi:hypothetical protein